MESNVNQHVKDYVIEHYPKMFKNKNIIVTEGSTCYFVSTNKDESPLILNKNVK